MRTRKFPRGARHLRAYAEFESYLVDFTVGRYPFLWIVGRPGISKTESLQAALRGRQAYYRKGGQLTPLQFYIDCFHYQGQPIILDDAEHLLDSRLGARLVSALGDTSPTKQMSYATTSHALNGVPPVFSTTSSLCIVANRATGDEAILSRAVVLYFDPTNSELHRAVASWYWDQEIHDWFGQHVNRLRAFEPRWYLIAFQDKSVGRDWRRIAIKAHALDRTSAIIQDVEADATYTNRESKADRYVELMAGGRGASRATYFRLRRRLEQDGLLTVNMTPPIPLRRTRPPDPLTDLELESLATGPLPAAEEPATHLDLPARAEFARPIQGLPSGNMPAASIVLDDRTTWEGSEEAEAPEDEE